jgi:chromate reductase, NAD(P)H dehydrogenase (quinone)
VKVFAMDGSTRPGSWNKKLLKLGVAELKKHGAEVDLLELAASTVPVFDDDLVRGEKIPAGVRAIKERIRAADGLLICTPEYNYSVPGPLKNFIDWMSRPPSQNPFKGKLTAQMGATPGSGGTIQAQAMLKHILGVGVGAFVMPGMAYTVSKVESALDPEGQLKDDAQKKHLADFIGRFTDELQKRAR